MQKFITFLTVLTISLSIQCSHAASENESEPQWQTISQTTTATVYNAIASQCDSDYLVTASNYRIDKENIENIRICAMERTMMKKHKIKYGTYIKISGTGHYDGIWRIEDTMNKRFAGQEKIDLLVPDDIKTGLWKNVTISIPANRHTMLICKNHNYDI